MYWLFLLFPEPVCARNSEKKFELFTYQAMPTMTPPLFSNPFQLTHYYAPINVNPVGGGGGGVRARGGDLTNFKIF